MKSLLSVTIQMKATEQYFPVVLFIMLYKVVPAFESVEKILQVWPFQWKLLSSTFLWHVYYALQGDSTWLRLKMKFWSATVQAKAVVEDHFIMTVPGFDF